MSWNGNQRGNWGQGYPNPYPQSNRRPVKKHSGARWVQDKKLPERPTMIGWNYSRRNGLISFIGCEIADSQNFKSKNPKNADYKKWVVTVNFGAQGKKTFNGLFRLSTQKLYIPDLNMVANPSAPNGGYWGQSGKPRR